MTKLTEVQAVIHFFCSQVWRTSSGKQCLLALMCWSLVCWHWADQVRLLSPSCLLRQDQPTEAKTKLCQLSKRRRWSRVEKKWLPSAVAFGLPAMPKNPAITSIHSQYTSICYIPGGTKKRTEHSHGIMQQSSRNESAESTYVMSKHLRICLGILA